MSPPQVRTTRKALLQPQPVSCATSKTPAQPKHAIFRPGNAARTLTSLTGEIKKFRPRPSPGISPGGLVLPPALRRRHRSLFRGILTRLRNHDSSRQRPLHAGWLRDWRCTRRRWKGRIRSHASHPCSHRTSSGPASMNDLRNTMSKKSVRFWTSLSEIATLVGKRIAPRPGVLRSIYRRDVLATSALVR